MRVGKKEVVVYFEIVKFNWLVHRMQIMQYFLFTAVPLLENIALEFRVASCLLGL